MPKSKLNNKFFELKLNTNGILKLLLKEFISELILKLFLTLIWKGFASFKGNLLFLCSFSILFSSSTIIGLISVLIFLAKEFFVQLLFLDLLFLLFIGKLKGFSLVFAFLVPKELI